MLRFLISVSQSDLERAAVTSDTFAGALVLSILRDTFPSVRSAFFSAGLVEVSFEQLLKNSRVKTNRRPERKVFMDCPVGIID
jgi:hypothetical protein